MLFTNKSIDPSREEWHNTHEIGAEEALSVLLGHIAQGLPITCRLMGSARKIARYELQLGKSAIPRAYVIDHYKE